MYVRTECAAGQLPPIGVAVLLRGLAGPGTALADIVVYMCEQLAMEGQILLRTGRKSDASGRVTHNKL
jgi:hypothetical protein